MNRSFGRFLRDEQGAVVIETAIVTPVLLLLALGAFEASMMVSRQVELQNAAGEAAQIALAAAPTTQEERDTVQDIIVASTRLEDADVTIAEKFRCGLATTMTDAETDCGDDPYAKFVQVTLTDTYTPIWARIAFGSPLDYYMVRTVQIG